jgi:phage/plasmid-like protein (TIGR03299 family)
MTDTKTVGAVATDRVTPYLRHGAKVSPKANMAEALAEAGLDWEVELVPALHYGRKGQPEEVPGRFVCRRKDTLQPFDVVGRSYHTVQNLEALGLGDALHEVGGAKFVAAGTIASGRGVWVAFELPGPIVIGGEDRHDLTGLLETTHDGKRATRLHVAPVRFACTNVMNLMVRGAVQRWSIPHTSKASERLAEAAVSVGLIKEYVSAFEATGERLLRSEMGEKALDGFLDRLVPARPRKADEVAAIKALVVDSPTNEFGRGTAYAALNGVREYYDHVRPQRTSESAFIGAYTGVNARTTNRALEMLENRAAGRAM